MDGSGFSVHISAESMSSGMSSLRAKKKKRPQMVQASFQAGNDPMISGGAASTSTLAESEQTIEMGPAAATTFASESTEQEEVKDDNGNAIQFAVKEGGFQIVSTFEGADEATNHFQRMRQKDKQAYETKQR